MTETNANASAIYKVGDKVRIIAQAGDDCTSDAKIGGIAEILKEFDGMHYRVRYEANDGDDYTGRILPESIEKVVDKPTKNQRISALEAQVSELKAEVEALKRTTERERALKETVAKYDGALRKLAEHKPAPTPNELRKAIIAEARAFVTEYERLIKRGETPTSKAAGDIYVDLHSNPKKRVTTAIVRWANVTGVRDRVFAKCAPGDVFNADIGKAIALGRALGLDVSKFEQAVQPTEGAVGMYVFYESAFGSTFEQSVTTPGDVDVVNKDLTGATAWKVTILSDTEAQYD